MRNGITNHCKTLSHFIVLYSISLMCCLFAHASLATNSAINVYLKFKPDNQVASLITDFNHFLQQRKLLNQYHINPFINNHPLHVTLYLTDYEEDRLPEIIKQIRSLAREQTKITLSTRKFIATEHGYVSLTVKRSEQLQQLSNKTVHLLANLRNKTALIPAWAANDPQKVSAFKQFGSPNVLHYFNPHFSIFDREKQNTQLYKELRKLIIQFSKTHRTEVNAIAYAIGVGIADGRGQIIKELTAFELKGSPY